VFVCLYLWQNITITRLFLHFQEKLANKNRTFESNSIIFEMAKATNLDLEKQLYNISTILEKSNSSENNLTEQVKSKVNVLQIKSKETKQLQSTLNGLQKRVESLNWTTEWLCERPKDVSTCMLEAVTVLSL
jgi:hypothetical protein